MNKFEIRNSANGTIEIFIYDAIGYYGISSAAFADALKPHSAAETIHVRLNSPGGNVFDALAMYNMLASHNAKVVINIDGIAASAASLLAMAGDEISIAENAMMMIHNPFTSGVCGDSAELATLAEMLAKLTQTMAEIYGKRTGLGAEKITDMLNAETWMTAAEAKTLGFATQIGQQIKAAALFNAEAIANYSNAPEDLMQRLGITSAAARHKETLQQHKLPERNQTTMNEVEKALAEATQRNQAIMEAFPHDPKMALDAIAKNMTVEQAKAAAYDQLGEQHASALAKAQQETKAATEENEKLRGLLGQRGIAADFSASDGDGKVDNGTPAAKSNDKNAAQAQKFVEAVKAKISDSVNEAQACQQMAKSMPEAHEAWVEAGQPGLFE